MEHFSRLLKKSVSGFTLVEMLVVMAVIAILMTMGMAAYGSTQKSARDARRRADVKQMQNALEQHFTTNQSAYSNGCSQLASLMQNGRPLDPLTGQQIGCTTTSSTYCVYAELENETGNCNVSGSTCTMVTDSAGTHVCQTALQ